VMAPTAIGVNSDVSSWAIMTSVQGGRLESRLYAKILCAGER